MYVCLVCRKANKVVYSEREREFTFANKTIHIDRTAINRQQIVSHNNAALLLYLHLGADPQYYNNYIKVTTLSGVSYASVYEQTHSSQCCNLFIS